MSCGGVDGVDDGELLDPPAPVGPVPVAESNREVSDWAAVDRVPANALDPERADAICVSSEVGDVDEVDAVDALLCAAIRADKSCEENS